MSLSSGLWICVDGVDGVGKSTLVERLVGALPGRASAEFSASLVGAALRASVARSPNYILRSRVGQSLVFLGDFLEVYEAQIVPEILDGRVVISDRGWVSKYAFQFVTLADDLGPEDAMLILEGTLGRVPIPDLTLYLEASSDILYERIVRRDGVCDSDRIEFNRRAHAAATVVLSRMPPLAYRILDASRSRSEVFDIASRECLRLVRG